MNKKLLLMSIAMLTCVATFAQNFSRPKASDYQFASEMKNTLQAGTYWEGDTTIYYLYNVDADAFLSNNTCSGHSQWATHAAVKKESGNKVFIAQYRLSPVLTIDTTYVEGAVVLDTVKVDITPWDGVTYKILDYYSSAWRGVFPTSSYAMFIDRASQPDYMWNVKSQGNGVYRISVSDLNPTYNSQLADSLFGNKETFLGFYWEDQDYDPTADSPVMPLTPMISAATSKVYDPAGDEGARLVDAANPAIDWKFMPVSEYDKFQSNLKAYTYIADGSLQAYIDDITATYGSKVSTAALEALLNSTTPMLYEDIEAAEADVQEAIRNLKIQDMASATEEKPYDATALMTNADFEAGNTSGWTLNYTKGTTVSNLGYQSASYTNGEVTISKFIEAWAAAGTTFNSECSHRALGNGSVYQVVQGLPAGKYTFTCDALASYQDNASETVTGAYLYAKAGDYSFTQAISTGNGAPEHFEVTFVNPTEQDFELGFMTDNTNANWMACDNFTLTYYGPVKEDPYKIVLETAKETAYNKYGADADGILANKDVKEAYAAEYEKADACTENYQDETAALNAAVKALDTSVSEYKTLKTLMDQVQAKQEAFNESDFTGLGDQLGDLYMELEEAYSEGTATPEYINNVSSRMSEIIVNYITENVKAGDEITALIDNPDFDENFSGWKTTGATPAFGGRTSDQGTNTLTDVVLTSGNAEVYHAAFNMYQIIRNMPKGSFKLTCQAFERNDNGYVNYWAQGPEAGITAVLYANNFESKVNNILAYAQENQVYANGAWSADVSTDYGYVPNGMTGANYFFNLDEDRQTYLVTTNFTLTEAGDSITIGLKTTATNSWIIFDNFRLYYNGDDISAYQETIDGLKNKLETVFDEATTYGNDAKDAVDAAKKALEEASNSDQAIAAISQADEALKLAEASIAAYASIDDVYTTISENIELYQETASQSALDAATEAMDALEEAQEKADKTAEEVEALVANANRCNAALITDAKLAQNNIDPSVATSDAPVDMSVLIENATFDTIGDFTGWSGTGFAAGGTTSTNAERYECTFDTYQELAGLPAGYYVAKVQGYYRRGSTTNDYALSISQNPDSCLYTQFYTTSDVQENYTPVVSIGKQANADSSNGVVYGSSGLYVPNTMAQATVWFDADPANYLNEVVVKVGEEGTLRIGVRKSTTLTSDWAIFDNFQLYYYGSEAPTAIKAVEETATVAPVKGIYNLAGQKLNSLQKGINIVNGKKYFVK